jgi:hypothetical protein
MNSLSMDEFDWLRFAAAAFSAQAYYLFPSHLHGTSAAVHRETPRREF